MEEIFKNTGFPAHPAMGDFAVYSAWFRQDSSFTCTDSIGCVHIAKGSRAKR